jgi:PAT family beta-lactamase induction signal transducer AmpG
MKAGDANLATGSRWWRPGGDWLAPLAVYRKPRLVAILLMGFSSGLPLALTFGTLSYWLADIGVSLTTIGLFGLVRTSYSLKFLWSPLIDRLPLPLLTKRLGRRRSWALMIQALLAVAILALGLTDPRADPALTALAAVVVAFLSASQDIVIDAYRIELLLPEEQGAGAAATQWGYRFGMLASGAGALYAASFGGWSFAYAVMAALMGVGMVTVWLTPEPGATPATNTLPGPTALARIRVWLNRAVVAPFLDLFARNGASQLIAIGVFIVLYKFGDSLAGSMSNPLYVALGFTKVEVATIAKVYGVVATLIGVAVGGVFVARLGVFRALLICGGMQALSNLLYALQVWAGHDVAMLTLTIAAENVTGGMASASFVAYLSLLCSREFTATQYALL